VASTHDVAIDELLERLGFSGDRARQEARTTLDDAKLTNPKKQRVSLDKEAGIRELLAGRFTRSCSRAACKQAAERDGRTVLEVPNKDCEYCGGQENRAEIDRAIKELARRGIARVVIVGGSPATHEELTRLIGERLDVRLISGTDRRNGTAARGDIQWAQLVVVWGGTELDHKVSKLYTDGKAAHVVTCAKRGIASLAATIMDAARRRGS
jgi:hypothetical protein